jgi:hypothetical protein
MLETLTFFSFSERIFTDLRQSIEKISPELWDMKFIVRYAKRGLHNPVSINCELKGETKRLIIILQLENLFLWMLLMNFVDLRAIIRLQL